MQLPDALLLPTVLTQAVNLEGMAGGVKVIFAANILFQLAHFRRKELHGNAAFSTYHVMVAAAVELVLITGHVIMKGHNAGQAAFRQQLERAIYGGESDLRVFFAGEAEELICRKVVAGLQKGAENGVALFGVLEADALQVLKENLLGLAHSFARGRSMIVNPALQRGHIGLNRGKAQLKIEIHFQLEPS